MKRILAAAASLTALGGLGLGWIIARRITAPVGSRRYDLAIRGLEDDGERKLVVLDRNSRTESKGIYCLLFPDEEWLQLSDEVLDRGPDRIARPISGIAPGSTPQVGDYASWSGIYFTTPSDAGLVAREVTIENSAGDSPAWLIDGTHAASTWAIHLHGLGGSRAGTLRGAQVATDLGYTSLIITYRNDGDGPVVARARSTLGFTEVADAESAVDFALAHGARRIVLFGWSMGAVIATLLMQRNRRPGTIAALVLESPVLDWPATIRANCARAGLPAAAGWLALPWLGATPMSRLVGLPVALPLWRSSRASRERPRVPTLVLQGSADDSVLTHVVEEIARRYPGDMEMQVFEAAHTMTWNSDPERWRSTVSTWLTERVSTGARGL
ncbi:phospholipase/Carboxylesterasex [Microbacterium sp. HM58-2]|nr:phospholipase/Carboxylesterasex [Microbacterium sp. HM58-2]